MKDIIINELRNRYSLEQRDMGELKNIHKGMYNFDCEAYTIKGVGNLFFINMKAMFGLMKMETCVLTPIEKDLSFCNIDIIKAMGNETYMFEMYDTCINQTDLSDFDPIKEKYKDLENYETAPRWYDSYKLPSCICKKGKKITAKGEALMKECLNTYLDLLDQVLVCDPVLKTEKNKVYVERLLSEGGAAVDSMNKIIGQEKTGELIRKFMYHTVD
ncbi:MAG: hypothetical protein IKS54_11360 [Erysipelotrichaceae bacterium]|nr:hypothetical protein [Erysipelotrichaceae bacterium]